MAYFFWFWMKVIRRAFYIIGSRKIETRRAYALLNRTEEQFGGRFNPATKKKIALSYGIYKPMICDAFTRLEGRNAHADEKERFIHYFICSSLFDDFTDHELITEARLYAISFEPGSYTPDTFDERVFIYSHHLLREFVRDRKGYDDISHRLFDAQIESKKQYNSRLSGDEIKTVTFEKGGNAVLLCSYYLDHQADQYAYACWYHIGTLIQLTNDLFDIYKDLHDHITTLPNQMKDAFAFEAFFISIIAEMKTTIRALPCSRSRQREFSLSMSGIYAFGLIAIDRLKKIQSQAGRLPDLKTLPREALVIDMEKISNLAKWFRFVYREMKDERMKEKR